MRNDLKCEDDMCGSWASTLLLVASEEYLSQKRHKQTERDSLIGNMYVLVAAGI